MSVEHWLPRSGFADSDGYERRRCAQATLNWDNLLGVCVGRAVVSPDRTEDHCDVARGNRRLHLNPANEMGLVNRFRVNSQSGEVTPADEADERASNDVRVLNLNAVRLKANRAEAIKKVRQMIRRDDGQQNLLRLWRLSRGDGTGDLTPYSNAVESYLSAKLRSHGIAIPRVLDRAGST